MMTTFRDNHPAPWAVEATPSGFKVLDANGVVLCYIYAVDGYRTVPSIQLTTAEARTLAGMIAWLPEIVET